MVFEGAKVLKSVCVIVGDDWVKFTNFVWMDYIMGYTDALKEGAGRLLFDSAAEGLLIVNEQGAILVANRQLEQMFGYEQGELIGATIEKLIPPALHKKHEAHRAAYREAPRKRSMGKGMDLSARKKNGDEFPVEVSLNHFKQGDQLMVMALVTDITERKLAEERLQKLNQSLERMVEDRTRALEESQYLYRTIARNFPNGTINVFDRDLNYVFAEGQELFRYRLTSDVLVGTSYLDRLPANVRDEIEPQLKKVFEGVDLNFEVEARGETYLLNAVGLPDRSGAIHQVLVVEQNISHQKQVQKTIREALDKEKQLNELKSRFVSMASHEFRTPLSTILTSVSLLKRYNDGHEVDKRMKHLNRVHTSVQNLTSILNDFLSLDKLEEGRIQPKVAPFEANRVLLDLVEEMETLTKHGQRIEVKQKNDCLLHGDEHMLRNVLINLLSNAIKYSPENSVITVACESNGNQLLLSVSDQGIGIPEEEQAHLFTRFFRASNAINIQGTGLGLHIVKRYVDLLNGQLEFTSISGQGTTFTIHLPIAQS